MWRPCSIPPMFLSALPQSCILLAMTSNLLRLASSAGFALALGLVFTPGCGTSQEWSYVPTRTASSYRGPTAPEATIAKLTDCTKEFASRLQDDHQAILFDVKVSTSGYVSGVEIKDSSIPDHALEACLKRALEAMSVPRSILDGRSEKPSPQSRELMGNALLLGGGFALAPMFITAAGITIVVVATLYLFSEAATATKDITDEESEKERCRKVFDVCTTKCMTTLPTGQFSGDKYHKCLRECMEANDCWGTKRY